MSRDGAKHFYDRQSGDPQYGFISDADAKAALDVVYDDIEAFEGTPGPQGEPAFARARSGGQPRGVPRSCEGQRAISVSSHADPHVRACTQPRRALQICCRCCMVGVCAVSRLFEIGAGLHIIISAGSLGVASEQSRQFGLAPGTGLDADGLELPAKRAATYASGARNFVEFATAADGGSNCGLCVREPEKMTKQPGRRS